MVPSVDWVTLPMMWNVGSIGNLALSWQVSGPVWWYGGPGGGGGGGGGGGWGGGGRGASRLAPLWLVTPLLAVLWLAIPLREGVEGGEGVEQLEQLLRLDQVSRIGHREPGRG